MNANISTIVGRLAGNPILKPYKKADGSDGFRAFFRVAVTRRSDLGKKGADRRTNFIPVVCWGGLAQRVGQYLAKGTMVTVIGENIFESQKQEDGSYKEFAHVQADSIQFGPKSMKNASPEDLQSQLTALQTRMEALAAGHGAAPAETPAEVPAETPAAPAEGGNPFETPASA